MIVDVKKEVASHRTTYNRSSRCGDSLRAERRRAIEPRDSFYFLVSILLLKENKVSGQSSQNTRSLGKFDKPVQKLVRLTMTSILLPASEQT